MTVLPAPAFRDGAPYEAIERIGAGAMGDVWLARDERDGGRVVIKVMHGHLPPSAIDRLRLEAQALQTIHHPNVVRVLDWGSTTDQRPFLVLEHLVGEPLDAVMKERTLTLAESVRLMIELCDALSATHEAGMVHRDVKPSNAFVCRPGDGATGAVGTLKLLDFGIVKLVENVTGVAPLQVQTQAGTAVGTPKYMSPEAARGRPVDGRADLYGVGVMLYELVAGRHPFAEEKTFQNMLLAHVKTVPRPPSAFAAQPIPERLDGIVLTALAKKPDDRFPNAAEMARALTFFAMDFLEPGAEASSANDATMVPLTETAVLADPAAPPKTLPFRALAPPRTEELPAAPAVARAQPASRSAAMAPTPDAAAAAPHEPIPRLETPAETAETGSAPIGRFLLTFAIVVAIAVGLYLAFGAR